MRSINVRSLLTYLEPHELKNYRPVSNLSFVWKLVERAAVKQLTDYLETNGLLALLQSAYRSQHSTETALLKVLSDVLTAIDKKKVTLLALLDLMPPLTVWTTTFYCPGCSPGLV